MSNLHPDLFDPNPTRIVAKDVRGPINKRKKEIGYVLQWDSKRQCRHCEFCVRLRKKSRTYYKCQAIGITNSSASDIRLYAHCRLFKKATI